MYTNLDELIVLSVGSSPQNPMYARAVASEGKRIADAAGRDEMRVIDGRMQHLRRKGRIIYYKKEQAPSGRPGWYLPANTEAKPTREAGSA